MFGGCGDLGKWRFGNLGMWGFGDVGIWKCGNMEFRLVLHSNILLSTKYYVLITNGIPLSTSFQYPSKY